MYRNLFKKTSMAVVAVSVIFTSGTFMTAGSAQAALGIANPTNSTVHEQQNEVTKVAGRRHRHGHRHRNRHGRHWGHDYYDDFYYDDCRWRKKRFWDGYGYYYRKVRICY